MVRFAKVQRVNDMKISELRKFVRETIMSAGKHGKGMEGQSCYECGGSYESVNSDEGMLKCSSCGCAVERFALDEDVPKELEPTVLALKRAKNVDNPFALARWMQKQGYQLKGMKK